MHPAPQPSEPAPRVAACVAASAAARLATMQAWIAARPSPMDVLVVAPTRGAADDFARETAAARGATFGLSRASLREMVVKLALPELARRGESPASALTLEALAARVASEAADAGELSYLRPMATRPGFRRTLLHTLTDVRLADLAPETLVAAPRTGPDLRTLAARFDTALREARVADHAALLSLATIALDGGPRALEGRAVLLLDVPVHAPRERAWLAALARRAAALAIAIPAGDDDTRAALADLGPIEWMAPAAAPGHPTLVRVQQELFRDPALAGAPSAGDAAEAASAVEFFSAPGEGREAVEIARRLLREAAAGRSFDEMAVVVRAPSLHAAHLESALHRAGIPAWFSRGTSRPDPSGRALLALLACAAEGLSARRFAEYISLGQVPSAARAATGAAWSPPDDESLRPATGDEAAVASRPEDASGEPASRTEAAAAGAAPWRWEHLLHEAAVIGGIERWTRRLDGLERELRLRAAAVEGEDPDAPRARSLARDVAALAGLRAFALPVVGTMAAWPRCDTWGAWLDRFDELAPRVLTTPRRVRATLADLRPMTTLGPVDLDEVREVLADRLRDLHVDPPAHRQGRVFVGTPDALRGRRFEVVLIAGLAERIFPRRLAPDPLLLDAARARLSTPVGDASPRRLTLDSHRTHDERLRLRLAAGAATARLYASFPSMEMASARPRVPSFYALDLHRALTGRLPDHDSLAERAAAASGARLAWPAPPDPATAIDAAEHDLATLRHWLLEPSRDLARGRARYLLDLSATLSRSLRARYFRAQRRWTAADGLAGEPHVRRALAAFRLRARPYSPSSLQRFAACPYQFYLATILRIAPREEATSIHRLDALTRGRLVHEIIARTTRDLMARNAWPSRNSLPAALERLSAIVAEVAARYRDDLAPPVDSVWREEVASIDADLRGWLHHVAGSPERWVPMLVEFGIGFGPANGSRDAASVSAPVALVGGWRVHGIVDVVEQDAATGALRVTDYKTGRAAVGGAFTVAGGAVLQPALYGMAVEAALDRSVEQARLYYCTAAGRHTPRTLTLTPDTAGARRSTMEVLEIIDRAIDAGFLPQAPRPHACARCDFRVVCGPVEERRVGGKDPAALADLHALRGLK